MLFQFSHDQGIKYNKQSGDSLIKLNNRSISTDINQLIEEILNAPSTSSSTVTNENNKEQIGNYSDPKKFNGLNIWFTCLLFFSFFVLISTITYSIADFSKWLNKLLIK